MNYISKRVKNFFLKTKPEYYEEFKVEYITTNLIISKFMFIITAIIECFVALMYMAKYNYQFNVVVHKFYFKMYIFLILVSILGIIFTKLFKDKVSKYLLVLEGLKSVFFLIWLIWGILISIEDIKNGGSSIVYIQMIMCLGIFFYTQPLHAIIIYFLAHCYYIKMLFSLSLTYNYIYPEIINTSIMIILMVILIYSRYKMKCDNFRYIKIIEKKNDELKRNNNELYDISILDPLTNIYNRRKIMDEFKYEYLYCKEKKQACVCCLVDIDYFKKYNDSYGHVEGDECLKKVSKTLIEIVKKYNGYIGRYGGEEFLLLFTQYCEDEMDKISNELRASIEELIITNKNSEVSQFVTLSLGVYIAIPTENKTRQHFIEEADKALYHAKDVGRNTYIIKNDIL